MNKMLDFDYQSFNFKNTHICDEVKMNLLYHILYYTVLSASGNIL